MVGVSRQCRWGRSRRKLDPERRVRIHPLEDPMGLVIAILLLALLLGGVGLLVEGLFWLLIIALALFVISAVMGMASRSRA
jgi:hypothetical protein